MGCCFSINLYGKSTDSCFSMPLYEPNRYEYYIPIGQPKRDVRREIALEMLCSSKP